MHLSAIPNSSKHVPSSCFQLRFPAQNMQGSHTLPVFDVKVKSTARFLERFSGSASTDEYMYSRSHLNNSGQAAAPLNSIWVYVCTKGISQQVINAHRVIKQPSLPEQDQIRYGV